MENIKINIYEARTMLDNMLNIKGFNKNILGKKTRWTVTKFDKREFKDINPGFNEDDIVLMNNGLRDVSEFCKKRLLKLPSSCNDNEIYAEYVTKQITELREVVSMTYIRENFTDMTKITFCRKLKHAPNRHGNPIRFSEENISDLNSGIQYMVDTFSRLILTL